MVIFGSSIDSITCKLKMDLLLFCSSISSSGRENAVARAKQYSCLSTWIGVKSGLRQECSGLSALANSVAVCLAVWGGAKELEERRQVSGRSTRMDL